MTTDTPTPDLDAMMADGLLDTVRRAAMDLYGETQPYPCDDVRRMADEIGRLRGFPDTADTDCECCVGSGLQADGETPCPCVDNLQIAEIAALRAENERLLKQNDNFARSNQGLRCDLKEAEAERDRLQAELARVRGLLAECSTEQHCRCMDISPETERAYENGRCVHQRARAALNAQKETD